MNRDNIFLALAALLLFGAITLTVLRNGPRPKTVEIVTSLGTMRAVLFDETPLHRDNFLKLAREGFYDSSFFHRTIPSFMIQGGDPYTKDPNMPVDSFGSGGPGYTLPAEILPGFWHFKGALCAARLPNSINPEKRSSGSQFYIVDGRQMDRTAIIEMARAKNITYEDAAIRHYAKWGGSIQLDGDYTVFGQVYDGLEVIDPIAEGPRFSDVPINPVKMAVREVQTGNNMTFVWLGLFLIVLFALTVWAAGKIPAPKPKEAKPIVNKAAPAPTKAKPGKKK